MKKIILVLLVLLCRMSLFAETYTFYTGDEASYKNNKTTILEYNRLHPCENGDISYFTKIIQTNNSFFEIELLQNGYYFTYQVKKGDYLQLIKTMHYTETKEHSYLFKKKFLVSDIQPNKIVLVETIEENETKAYEYEEKRRREEEARFEEAQKKWESFFNGD